MKWYKILKLARKTSGFSLREVEKRADVLGTYVFKLENGQIKEPPFFKMLRLLSLYNLTPKDLGTKE